MLSDDLIRKLEKFQREIGVKPVEFADYSPHGIRLPVGKLEFKNNAIFLCEEDGRQPDGSLIKDSLSPTPQDARKLLSDYKKDIVIILSMDFQNQELAYSSYGSTIKFSDLGNNLGDMIWQFAKQILEKPDPKKEIKP